MPGGATSVGPFNLDRRRGLRAAVAARAVHGELVIFTSNVNGLSAAANMALQLQKLGLPQHLVLADERQTCTAAHARWNWLGCGWSGGLPGFEEKYAAGWGGETARLWSLWSAKWVLLARLVELRVNVLALDTDMMLIADPYPLLHTPPISHFKLVIVPEGSRVNLGFIYARGKSVQPAGGVMSVLWDVVRRLRLFTEDWPLLGRTGSKTSTAGLWDQGLFTDAICSAVSGEIVYPYTFLQSPRTGVWKVIGWPPAALTVANISDLHTVPWYDARHANHERIADIARASKRMGVRWRAPRPSQFLPPGNHPQRLEWSAQQHPLLWTALRALDPIAQLRRRSESAVTPGWLDARLRPRGGLWPRLGSGDGDGLAGGGHDGSVEAMLATPDWLYCLVGRWAITAGWPSLAPRAVCAVVHLVETRSQFGAWSSFKAARPFVMRALGHWHLPEPPPTPMEPRMPELRGGGPATIRLAWSEWAATGRAQGIGALLNALHRLSIFAALSGRTPVIPRVPCTSKWILTNRFGRAGLADDYILQVPNASHSIAAAAAAEASDGYDGASVECHLSMGGRQCMLPMVLPAWARPHDAAIAFLGNHSPEAAPALAVDGGLSIVGSSSGGGGGGGQGGAAGGCGRQLTADLDALRDAFVAARSAAMVEMRSSLLPNDGTGAPGSLECREPDSFDESLLLLEERARLRVLRSACPAFFGSQRNLHLLHRRRGLFETDRRGRALKHDG